MPAPVLGLPVWLSRVGFAMMVVVAGAHADGSRGVGELRDGGVAGDVDRGRWGRE